MVTGGFLAQRDLARIFGNVRQYFVAGIRLLILPALVYVIFSSFIADPLILGVVVRDAGGDEYGDACVRAPGASGYCGAGCVYYDVGECGYAAASCDVFVVRGVPSQTVNDTNTT